MCSGANRYVIAVVSCEISSVVQLTKDPSVASFAHANGDEPVRSCIPHIVCSSVDIIDDFLPLWLYIA